MRSLAHYRCDKCGGDFPSLAKLAEHKVKAHPG